MKNSITKTLVLASMTLLLSSSAQAAENAISIQAVEEQQQRHHFEQNQVANCEGLSSVRWGINDIQYVDGELTIQGIDKVGRHYSIEKGTGFSGCKIWAADLDGSGAMDLEILTPGQDSSGGYDNVLTVILFNAEGRPFPWQATGKFTATDAGIDQILADPTTKNASVIVPTKEGITGPDANLAFELYRFMPFNVMKINETFLGLKWPVTYNVTPALIRHRQAASLTIDLGANMPMSRLTGSSTPKITGESFLSLANGEQIEPPAVLVEDSSDGSRLINADPMPEDIARLVQNKAHIKTVGRTCEEEECRPMVLITTP